MKRKVAWVVMMMFVAIVVSYVISAVVGVEAALAWFFICFPAGWFSGALYVKNEREREREEQR